MGDWLKTIVLRLALVPAEPQVPEGSAGSTTVFHPGRNYYYLRLLLWLLGNALLLVLLAVFLRGALIPKLPPIVRTIWTVVGSVAAAGFLISLPFTYLVQRLNYQMRWYIVTDRSLRIRTGILQVQELTMTFANIQEIRVSVNPLQKLLSLANVEVHSAGGGTGSHGESASHVALFESVDNASAIRDLIVERLRLYRDSGLGSQPNKSESPIADGVTSDTLQAAENVLHEVRALRTSLASR